MKEKIIIFFIGLLVGSIISTGSIYAYTALTHVCKGSDKNMQITNGNMPSQNNNGNMQAPGGNMPEQNNQTNNNGQPPEKPADTNTTQTQTNNN